MDWLSAFVGIVVGLAVSFGADKWWLYFGASPREKAERRKAKWQRKCEQRGHAGR